MLVYKRNKYFRMCCGRKIFSFGGNSSSSSCQVTSHNPIVDYFLITEHSQVFFIYTSRFQWYEVHIFVFSRKCLRSCNIFCLYLVYMIYLPLAFLPWCAFIVGFFFFFFFFSRLFFEFISLYFFLSLKLAWKPVECLIGEVSWWTEADREKHCFAWRHILTPLCLHTSSNLSFSLVNTDLSVGLGGWSLF